ncbi:MAG: hypothetical protein ACR2QT_04960 [Woeseiaceae bacterium]
MKPFLLSVILFTVAACATSTPEPIQPEPIQTSENTQISRAAPAQESGDAMLAQNTDMKNSGSIEALEAPSASETPAEMMPIAPPPEPEIICHKVVPTGSILPVKVCRTPEEIARKEAADKEIFRDIKNNSALGGANAAIRSTVIPVTR